MSSCAADSHVHIMYTYASAFKVTDKLSDTRIRLLSGTPKQYSKSITIRNL